MNCLFSMLTFIQRDFVVGLVEVLFDVLVLVRNLGPEFDAFLDAEDAARSGAKVLT